MGGIGVLGGTFNPVHGAHVRHAVEVGERLGLDRVLLMPNSVPPHKAARGLLPFLHMAIHGRIPQARRGFPPG